MKSRKATNLLLLLVLFLAGCGGSGGNSGTAPSTGTSAASTAAGVTTVQLRAPAAAASGRCVAPSPVNLKRATHAFEGTVTAVDGDRVTLSVARWYAGGGGTQVVVAGPSADLHGLLQTVQFKVGQRYLVAATADDTVMVCGLSGPYSQELAATYHLAFPNL